MIHKRELDFVVPTGRLVGRVARIKVAEISQICQGVPFNFGLVHVLSKMEVSKKVGAELLALRLHVFEPAE